VRFSERCIADLIAIRSVQDEMGGISYAEMFIALSNLLPTSALARALTRSDVWNSDQKLYVRQVVAAGSRTVVQRGLGSGTTYEGLVQAVESFAAGEGGRTAHERHLAMALCIQRPFLQQLGIHEQPLIDATTAYEEGERPDDALRVVALHPSTEVQANELASTAHLVDLKGILEMDERGGRLDWKRSILNSDTGVLARQEETLVALVNGNPGDEVFLVFGVEDDKTILGQVNQRGEPLSDDAVRASQRRLDQRLQQCRPAVRLSWTELAHPSGIVLVARAIGRRRGTGVMTTYGAYPYRSGEDTYPASPSTVAAWIAEEDPQLRAVLEARAESDRGTAELLARLVHAQEQAAVARRDQLFARLDIVGTALSTAGTGGITVKYVAGKEPARKVEAWALGPAGVGAGYQEWLSEGDRLVEIQMTATESAALLAGAFHEWAGISELVTDERLVGIAWEGFSGRRGRLAWRYSGDRRTERLFDEWDV